jgi:hypothetical protein
MNMPGARDGDGGLLSMFFRMFFRMFIWSFERCGWFLRGWLASEFWPSTEHVDWILQRTNKVINWLPIMGSCTFGVTPSMSYPWMAILGRVFL